MRFCCMVVVSVSESEFQFFHESPFALGQGRSIRRNYFRLTDSIWSSVNCFLRDRRVTLDLVERRRRGYISSSTQDRVEKVQHLCSKNRVVPADEDEHLPRSDDTLRETLT